MNEVTLVPPGGGEVLNETEGRWTEILCDTEELVVSLFRRAAGIPGPELHVHRTHADGFYALEGTLVVPLGPDAEPEYVPAGTFALAPPLVAHAFRMDAGDVALLNVHAPGAGFGDYMRGTNDRFDQEDPPADGGRPRADAVLGRADVVADEPGARVVVLADEEQLELAELTLAPGAAAPAPRAARLVAYYVLAGELTVGADELAAPAGTWLSVPGGAPHVLAGRGDAEARCLRFRVPAEAGFPRNRRRGSSVVPAMRTLAATMATITTITLALFTYALVTYAPPVTTPASQAVSR